MFIDILLEPYFITHVVLRLTSLNIIPLRCRIAIVLPFLVAVVLNIPSVLPNECKAKHPASLTEQCATQQCRCLPGDTCWPTDAQWSAFNTTLNGRLTIPRSTAYPCYHGPDHMPSDCRKTHQYYNKPNYLINKPGSMHFFNWEDLDEQRCSLAGANQWNVTCHSGRVPAYAVDAHTADDIRTALAFAKLHNLRVVVKSTGHDYLGRSTAPGALLIWLRNFQGTLQTERSFIPNGCDTTHRYNDATITVPAGKTWDVVYAEIEDGLERKYGVVGGYCYDVGASGGFAVGGGHGILSPSFGLAVDNILQMTLVTADGQLVTSNACQNMDLFWALRGGGGGFGIVTSVTYKLHPTNGFLAYSFLVVGQNGTGSLSGEQVQVVIEVLARYTAELDSAGWGGYFAYGPAYGFSVMLLIPADRAGTLLSVDGLKNALVDLEEEFGFRVRPFASVGQFAKQYDSFEEWRAWTATVGVFDGFNPGFRTIVGSRLIPATALLQSRTTAQTLVSGVLKNGLEKGWVGLLVAGHGVRDKDPTAQETSVTPAWRTAAWHCLLLTGWDAGTSDEDVRKKKDALNAGIEVWRDAFPESGVYSNEAFPEEPNWQQAFWGGNYERLLRIKKELDPDGVFVCNRCVGSEEWDQTGNCRLH